MIYECFDTSLRVRDYHETLRVLTRFKSLAGITRLADLTHLDNTGLPVYTAIRPRASSLSTSQGKGLTKEAAQCSALMESIEVYFAEQLTPKITNKSELDLIQNGTLFIPINYLSKSVRFKDRAQAMSWVQAELVFAKQTIMVPFAEYSLNSYLPEVLTYSPDTTGLAGGNTYKEALLHGLLEVIERCEPQQISEVISYKSGLVEQISKTLDCFITHHQNVYGVPSFDVLIRAKNPFENQILFKGCGCHLDKKIALNRALTEAVQSRVTTIAGSRDDLTYTKYDFEHQEFPRVVNKINFDTVQDYPSKTIDEALSILFDRIRENNQDILVHRYYEDELCILKVKLVSMDVINHA